MVQVINDAQLSTLILGANCYSQLLLPSVLSLCPSVSHVILIDKETDEVREQKEAIKGINFYYFDDMIGSRDGDDEFKDLVGKHLLDGSKDDLFTLMYTSGSSGAPKGRYLP